MTKYRFRTYVDGRTVLIRARPKNALAAYPPVPFNNGERLAEEAFAILSGTPEEARQALMKSATVASERKGST